MCIWGSSEVWYAKEAYFWGDFAKIHTKIFGCFEKFYCPFFRIFWFRMLFFILINKYGYDFQNMVALGKETNKNKITRGRKIIYFGCKLEYDLLLWWFSFIILLRLISHYSYYLKFLICNRWWDGFLRIHFLYLSWLHQIRKRKIGTCTEYC